MELLGDWLVRLIPVAIPIILIWSFLINHGLAPSGGSKKDDKPSKNEESKENKSDKPEG